MLHFTHFPSPFLNVISNFFSLFNIFLDVFKRSILFAQKLEKQAFFFLFCTLISNKFALTI